MITEVAMQKTATNDRQVLASLDEYRTWQSLAHKAIARQNPWHAIATNEVGGLAWLDQQMSFDREVAYLRDAYPIFFPRWQDKHPYDTEVETNVAYHELASLWLQSQITFFLTEFGAGKNLQIQPPYYLLVEHDDDGMFVSAANTRYFGDVASRFRDFNSQVGIGLEKVYEGSEEHQENFLGIVVSPTEKYQDFGSTTDVINFFAHAFLADTTEVSNEGLVLGCYLILNEILSNQQRAFIRNALTSMSEDGGINPDAVRTDAWLSSDEASWLPANPDIMVQHPHIGRHNPFENSAHFMRWLSDNFEQRFGKELIRPAEIAMYGYIEWLVQQNINEAYQLIKTGNKSDYYDLLRMMLFESQAVWKLLSETAYQSRSIEQGDGHLLPDLTVFHPPFSDYKLIDAMSQHLWAIRSGNFAIGGIHPSTGEGLSQFWDPIAQDWFGGDTCSSNETETCRKCGHELKENKCPKCEKKTPTNKIRD